MNLIQACIRYPVSTSVGVIFLALFGLIALFNLPVQLTPDVVKPEITVTTEWPGASPLEIEQDVINEQEEELKSLPGLVKMESESHDGYGEITLRFQVGTDKDAARLKASNRLDQVESYPANAKKPVISGQSGISGAIAWFQLDPTPDNGFAGDISTVYDFIDDYVVPELERVEGVSASYVYGGREAEVHVVVDPARLALRQVTLLEFAAAVERENRNYSGGDFDEGKRRYVVRTVGEYRSPQDLENIVIASRNGVPVYLRDVARVELTHEKPTSALFTLRDRTIALNIQREPGANELDIMAAVTEKAARINEELLEPRGLRLVLAWEQTGYIKSAVKLVRNNLLLGGALAVLVLLVFLRSAASTLIAALAIPISIIGTFLMMAVFGSTINVISLAGLAFATGMVVDNSIVVLENIYRHRQGGKSRLRAAQDGVTEVWGAVLASTLTTVAVFAPVVLIEEEIGRLFADIAVAISCAVALSLLAAVTVIPTMAARMLGGGAGGGAGAIAGGADAGGAGGGAITDTGGIAEGTGGEKDTGGGGGVAGGAGGEGSGGGIAGNAIAGGIVRAGGFHGIWGGAALALAARERIVTLADWINASIARRLVVVGAAMALAVSVSIAIMPKTEYLPMGDTDFLFGLILPPPGYTVAERADIHQRFYHALKELKTHPRNSPAAAAQPGGGLDTFFFGFQGPILFLGATVNEPRRTRELMPLLYETMAGVPGAIPILQQWGIFEDESGEGRSIDIEIKGPDLSRLIALGAEIFQAVGAAMPGAQAFPIPGLDLGNPEVRVEIDRRRAAELGVSNRDLGFAVSALVDGVKVSDYQHEGRELDIRVRAEKNFAHSTHTLEQMPIATPDGRLVTLGAIARVSPAAGPVQINHRERERTITIRVLPVAEMPTETAIEIIQRDLIAPMKDQGKFGGLYRVELSGSADKLAAAGAALKWNLLLALLITFLLMAALFESFLYPVVILLSVPLAVLGGFLGLALVNATLAYQPLDALTMLGFIILLGTVVNNPILIVHQSLNHARKEGMAPRAAIREAVRNRIRPIFMSAGTSTFAMLPLVLAPGAGSELYRGIGGVVIGGLLLATLLTLFVVPAMLSLVFDLRLRLTGRAAGAPADAAALD